MSTCAQSTLDCSDVHGALDDAPDDASLIFISPGGWTDVTQFIHAPQVLRWTQDWGRAKDLAWKVAGAYGEEFSAIAAPQSGVTEWLQLLARVNVPCAVVSAFDR